MVLNLKKSRITDWWITKKNDTMNFFNILSGEHLKGDFIVVGYLDNTKDLARSTNSVIRITKKGVITAQGTFYPFEEAHPLYLKFLLKANKANTVVASYWEILDEQSCTMIADIETPKGIQKGVTFDFISDNKSGIMFSGYSNKLSSKVVLATFRRRHYCSILDIPDVVISDIANSSIILLDDLTHIVKKVEKLFTEKFGDSYIYVNLF